MYEKQQGAIHSSFFNGAVNSLPLPVTGKAKLISKKPLITIDLNFDERGALVEAYEKFRNEEILLNENDMAEVKSLGSKMVGLALSESSKHKITQYFASPNERPAMLLRGLPVPLNLAPTPTKTGYINANEIGFSTALLVGIYAYFDVEPVAYAGENNDRILRHVVPADGAVDEVSSQGSKFTFGMHVDNPHLPLESEEISIYSACPQFLALKCMRTDINVPTNVLSLDAVLSKLPEFIVCGLQKPIYSIVRPDSFGAERTVIESLPIITTNAQGHYISRFDRKFAEPQTDEAEFFLNALIAAIDEHAGVMRMVLTPGDLLIFHNQRTLHSRDGFTPKFNGLDRWLIRLYGIKDMSRHIPKTEQKSWLGIA